MSLHTNNICKVCGKHVRKSVHSRIFCKTCKSWIHIKCNFLNRQDIGRLLSNWHCIICNSEIFPLSSNEIHSPPSKQILTGIANTSKSMFENLILDCKYYDIPEFNKQCISFTPKLSFFHMNISSLALHYGNLCLTLESVKHKFSFIGISETRFSKYLLPSENFQLPSYS